MGMFIIDRAFYLSSDFGRVCFFVFVKMLGRCDTLLSRSLQLVN